MIFKKFLNYNIDLFISLRYLFSKNKKIFNSVFINVLSVLGIMLGVASVIVTLSIMNGFKKNIVDRIFAANYHSSFLFPSKSIVDYKNFENKLSKIEDVKSFSPFIIKNGILKVKDKSFPIILKGVKEKEIETIDIKIGDIFDVKIVKIVNFGAFAEIVPGKEGLIHISQLDNKRVQKVEDVLSLGDVVKAKVIEIDRLGKINLSIKELGKTL